MFKKLFPHRGNILLIPFSLSQPSEAEAQTSNVAAISKLELSPSLPLTAALVSTAALGKILTQDFIIFHAKYHCLAPICGLSLILERLSPICSPKPSSDFNLEQLNYLEFWFHIWGFGSTPRCHPKPALQTLPLPTAVSIALPSSAAVMGLQRMTIRTVCSSQAYCLIQMHSESQTSFWLSLLTLFKFNYSETSPSPTLNFHLWHQLYLLTIAKTTILTVTALFIVHFASQYPNLRVIAKCFFFFFLALI